MGSDEPPPKRYATVFVKPPAVTTLGLRPTFTVRLPFESDVLALKHEIAARSGVPVDAQRLSAVGSRAYLADARRLRSPLGSREQPDS